MDNEPETNIVCDKCGKSGQIENCPYSKEVNDEIFECNCCEECYQDCCDEI